jgi:diguanylate cyclase (GGDEF)-like protein
MDLFSPDVLLSLLFIAIIVNSALMVFFIVNGRTRRRRREAAVSQALAASYVDPAPVSEGNVAAAVVTDAVAVATSTPESVASTPVEDDDPDGVPAGRDALTGLMDGPAFARLVALEEARVARYHRPATIVVFELDGLDRLIETLGRDAGDRVVPAVADTIRRLARDADRAARLAPGRFAVLLPETDEVAAINYVERVRRACELWLESGAMALRLAVGWAGSTGDPTLAEAQRVAIERMYAELRRGASRGEPEAVETPSIAAGPARIAS